VTQLAIRQSDLTEMLPPIAPGSVAINPLRYSSWTACFAANPVAPDILVTPGEYRGWHPDPNVPVTMPQGGTLGRRRTIRYHNPIDNDDGVHPVKRAAQAWVDPFKFSNVQNWMVSGLSLNSPISQFVTQGTSSNITFDMMRTEGFGLYTYRISSNNVTVQNSVARNGIKSGSDFVAVQIKPVDGVVPENIRQLNCEFYNLRDSSGITQDGTSETTEVRGIVYDNIDSYNEPDYFGFTENGLDFKTGSDTSRLQVKNSRFWGHWPGGAGVGDIIVFNQFSRNADITCCVFGESLSGIRSENFVNHPEFTRRGVRVKGCWFYRIEGGTQRFAGCIDFIHDDEIDDCHFIDCGYIQGSVPKSGYKLGGPRFSRCTTVNVPKVRPPTGTASDSFPATYAEASNRRAPAADFSYWRKQWTGPELVVVSKAPQVRPHVGSLAPFSMQSNSLGTKAARWRRR
jgi:hypothetical protein